MRSAVEQAPSGARVADQLDMAERIYQQPAERWAHFDSDDPAVRYAHDRRLRIAVDRLQALCGEDLSSWSALTVCGGVGGQGTYLANRGVGSVTVSDISPRALAHCAERDPRLATRQLDSEALDLPDASVDLVLVQDGLHHLPRPTLGFTEMLRVARRAVVVIEPHTGWVARALGQTWERHGEVVNHVFRWDETLLRQLVRSYWLEQPVHVEGLRCWDYTVLFYRLARKLGRWELASRLQKTLYAVLNATPPVRAQGNMMVGLVLKDPPARIPPVRRRLFA